MKKDLAEFKTMLHKADLKATPGRVALLSLLQGSKRPISIQEVMRGLKSEKVDQATVYRTLETLSSKGIVNKINLGHYHADYELAGDDHHHLICLNCDKVEDFKGCDFTDLQKSALKGSSFAQIKQHSLELFGLCKTCAR
jgi:Fur family transcriptional regulator, ferric uptake regulator